MLADNTLRDILSTVNKEAVDGLAVVDVVGLGVGVGEVVSLLLLVMGNDFLIADKVEFHTARVIELDNSDTLDKTEGDFDDTGLCTEEWTSDKGVGVSVESQAINRLESTKNSSFGFKDFFTISPLPEIAMGPDPTTR